MTKKNGVFVKINYKNDGRKCAEKNYDRSTGKQGDFQLGKYMFCAGTYNKNGGTIIFQARNMDEANNIVNNNPFTIYSMYRYEILNGDVISL